jgi:hypothetical protein
MFRILRPSTDVVSVVDRRNDIEYATIPVVKQSKDHAPQEFFGTFLVIDGLHDISVVEIGIMGVELWGDTLDIAEPLITRSDGIDDCPPPFIGGGTVNKYDQVSPSPVRGTLERGRIREWVLKDR